MREQVSKSEMKNSEESLRKAYRALDERITCETTINVIQEEVTKTFRNVEVELGISPRDSYIAFELKKEDIEIYKSLGLKSSYSVKNAIIEYKDNSDYQRSSKSLVVEPLDTDMIINFRLKRN